MLTGLPLSWGVLGMFHPGYTGKVSSRKCWKRISGRKSIDGLKKPTVTSCCWGFFDQLQSADRVCHLLCLLSCCQAVLEWRSMCICAGHPLPMTCYSSHTVIIKYDVATALTCYQSVQTDSRLHTNPRAPEVLERPALGRLDCYPV